MRFSPTKQATPVSPSPPPFCYFPLPSPRGRVPLIFQKSTEIVRVRTSEIPSRLLQPVGRWGSDTDGRACRLAGRERPAGAGGEEETLERA